MVTHLILIGYKCQSMFTRSVFDADFISEPGLGRMMIDAISDRDLPVVQAIALIVATVYVCVNLSADILTMFANPRLRTLHMRRG